MHQLGEMPKSISTRAVLDSRTGRVLARRDEAAAPLVSAFAADKLCM